MEPNFKMLNTARGTLTTIRSINPKLNLPKGNEMLYIAFPDGALMTVSKTKQKGTYGDILFEITSYPSRETQARMNGNEG